MQKITVKYVFSTESPFGIQSHYFTEAHKIPRNESLWHLTKNIVQVLIIHLS